MDYAYWAQQDREEEKQKKINELLERLKTVTEKDYWPNCKNQKGDREDWHVEADNILCELLDYLGYHDFVEEFEKVPKWYA